MLKIDNSSKARNLKNLMSLIVCEICSISVGLIIDCIIFYNCFKTPTTPVVFISILVATFVGALFFGALYLNPRFKAWLNEKVRKFFVALKKNPQAVPLITLCIAFMQFSLNLTYISKTTAKIQGSNMGLSAFVIMLFLILSFVCVLNAFPKRKKPVYAMVALMIVLYALVIVAEVNYLNCIEAALTRELSPIVITSETQYIAEARSTVKTSIILVCVTAVCVLLEPVFAKLFKKIKTSIEVEGSENIANIDIAEEE